LIKGEINEESVPVLNFIVDKTNELHNRYGQGWYPRFTKKEIQNNTGITKAHIDRAFNDLCGITTETIYRKGIGKYQRMFFLSRCRHELATQLIS
jgi:hypothetical protein